jgi:hypothetical protein
MARANTLVKQDGRKLNDNPFHQDVPDDHKLITTAKRNLNSQVILGMIDKAKYNTIRRKWFPYRRILLRCSIECLFPKINSEKQIEQWKKNK